MPGMMPSSMAAIISSSMSTPYAQAAAGSGPSGPAGNNSSNSSTVSAVGGANANTNSTANANGTVPMGSSGGILGLGPSQSTHQGAAQLPISPVGTVPGGGASMGPGNGGGTASSGGIMGSVAPARPPSVVKQNGGTSE